MVTEPRAARSRLALVDVPLAECDHLDRRFGDRLEVALVVVEEEGGPTARWAELGGYPWTTDLRRLSAVVADAVAVGAASERREQALALASLVGVPAAVLGGERTPDGEAVLRLEEALERLFGAAGPDPT